MCDVERLQAPVALRVERHLRHDAHAEAQRHVGLDHVGVERREHDPGLEPALRKGLLHQRAIGEGEVVSDDRVPCDFLQGDRRLACERVTRRHDHAAVPLVAGQRDELRILGDLLGGDGEVGLAAQHHLANLRGVSLVEDQLHVGVTVLERRDRPGQRVARLGMRGGDGEGACAVVRELRAGALQVRGLGEDALGDRQHRAPGLGDRGEALAVAHEDLHPQLAFEVLDLARDPGLRGMQRFGGGRDAQVAPGDFGEVAKLLELHNYKKA